MWCESERHVFPMFWRSSDLESRIHHESLYRSQSRVLTCFGRLMMKFCLHIFQKIDYWTRNQTRKKRSAKVHHFPLVIFVVSEVNGWRAMILCTSDWWTSKKSKHFIQFLGHGMDRKVMWRCWLSERMVRFQSVFRRLKIAASWQNLIFLFLVVGTLWFTWGPSKVLDVQSPGENIFKKIIIIICTGTPFCNIQY